MIRVRKHEAMYAAYGELPQHRCKDCTNFTRIQAGARRVSKCKAYGISASTATDWSGNKAACGLYGINFEVEKRRCLRETMPKITQQNNCDGQLTIAD